MPERLHPGVYVEEKSSGIRPIEGVSTSTAGFIGEAARGIPDTPHYMVSFADYERNLGGVEPGEKGFLAQAVAAFFASGGQRCYAVRVLPEDAEVGQTANPCETRHDAIGSPPPALSFKARGKGRWADAIRIHIVDSENYPDEAFNVRVVRTIAGATRLLEEFLDLRMDPQTEDYFADVISRESRYVTITDEFQAYLDDSSPDKRNLSTTLRQFLFKFRVVPPRSTRFAPAG